MKIVLIPKVSSCFVENFFHYLINRGFFSYGNDYGFRAFGRFTIEHFIWLFAIAVVIIVITSKYLRLDNTDRAVMDKIIGNSLLFLIVIRIAVICILGKMTVYELPLHLCSMGGILCVLFTYYRWEWTAQVLYNLCLPGTVCALIFPDWSFYPAIHFITIQAFLFHGGLVLYVLCQLVSGKIKPDIKKIWMVFAFLGIIVPIVYYIDVRYDVNFMFVRRPSPGSPLSWLADITGEKGYLTGYAVLVLGVIIIMNIIFNFLNKHKMIIK